MATEIGRLIQSLFRCPSAAGPANREGFELTRPISLVGRPALLARTKCPHRSTLTRPYIAPALEKRPSWNIFRKMFHRKALRQCHPGREGSFCFVVGGESADKKKARPVGFEPTTLGSEDRCAIQLRHGRVPLDEDTRRCPDLQRSVERNAKNPEMT